MLPSFSRIAALFAALAGCARRDTSPVGTARTLRQFQDLIATKIHQEHPSAAIDRVGDGELRIALKPGEEPSVLHLERAFGLYEGNPAGRAMIVERTVSSVGFETPGATPEAIIVLVRPGSFTVDGVGDPMLSRPLAAGLYAIVAVDTPERYAFVSASRLRPVLKLEDAAIWSRALQNTKDLIGPKPVKFVRGQATEIETDNGLAASLLACDDYWDCLARAAGGALVIAPFARDYLYVAPLSDELAVRSLRRLMAKVQDDPNGISNDLLVRRDGHWETLHP